jgi:hypothetical protein
MGNLKRRSDGITGVGDMEERPYDPSDAGYVQFWSAGDSAKGEYHCAECGYGVAVYRKLPLCPMCGGESWEQSAWSPLSRADWGSRLL